MKNFKMVTAERETKCGLSVGLYAMLRSYIRDVDSGLSCSHPIPKTCISAPQQDCDHPNFIMGLSSPSNTDC